jgi:hypothetical protein
MRRVLQSNPNGAFYINGPPGSGKSHLLKNLGPMLRVAERKVLPLGPYRIQPFQEEQLNQALLAECREMGYLGQVELPQGMNSYAQIWSWLEGLAVVHNQMFLVLLDLEPVDFAQVSPLADLFSDLRAHEGTWHRQDFQVFTVVAGHWLEQDLRRHCDGLNVSFPYTSGYNSAVWLGLPVEEFVSMIQQVRSDASPLHGRLLHELTGGHPTIAMSVLNSMPDNKVGLAPLLQGTRRAVRDFQQMARFFPSWRFLPDQARTTIQKLLAKRHRLASSRLDADEPLLSCGLIRHERRGPDIFLSFRSWFVELLLRQHAVELGLETDQARALVIEELVPEVLSLSQEAYSLINDIETTVRNFVTLQLSAESDPRSHYLIDRAKRYGERSTQVEDAYTRAVEWRGQSAERGLPTDLNPLITYSSTRTLADLVDEVGHELQSREWQDIGRAVRNLSDVRDAVMHNQLIDDLSLNRLNQLCVRIYQALARLA